MTVKRQLVVDSNERRDEALERLRLAAIAAANRGDAAGVAAANAQIAVIRASNPKTLPPIDRR
jgi:polysaccharide deacetylase 2 family uncharacterized protein YibQ